MSASPPKPGRRERLEAMDLPARVEALKSYFAKHISVWFLTDHDTALRLPLRPVMEKLGQDWAFLEHLVLKGLGLRLYPRELANLETVADLAVYLAKELDPIPHGVEPCGSEEGSWQWQDPPPVSDSPTDGLVLVLSTARSGSTLLRVMLAGHPELFAPPELWLLPFGSMNSRVAQLAANHLGFLGLGLEQAVAALWPEPQAAQKLASWRERNTPVASIYAELRARDGARWLIDKTPGYCASAAWLQHAEHVALEPRFIHLVRHPYPVVESMVRMRFHRMIGPTLGRWDNDPYRFAAASWSQDNRRIASFLGRITEGRSLLVHFEELVAKPEATMQRVCAFLGIPYVAAMVEPRQENQTAYNSHMQMHAIGDPSFSLRNKIDPSLANWQHLRLPNYVQEEVREMASMLGYKMA